MSMLMNARAALFHHRACISRATTSRLVGVPSLLVSRRLSHSAKDHSHDHDHHHDHQQHQQQLDHEHQPQHNLNTAQPRGQRSRHDSAVVMPLPNKLPSLERKQQVKLARENARESQRVIEEQRLKLARLAALEESNQLGPDSDHDAILNGEPSNVSDFSVNVNEITGEIGGQRGPEPTR